MRNEATPYADQAVRPVAVAGAVDVTRPAEGYYRFRLRSGSVFGGVRIWYGAPLDPVTGEELDRSWRWQALFNGEPIDLDRVWPTCAGDPITEDEYQTSTRPIAPDNSGLRRTRRAAPTPTPASGSTRSPPTTPNFSSRGAICHGHHYRTQAR
jgi:hypothetical protein